MSNNHLNKRGNAPLNRNSEYDDDSSDKKQFSNDDQELMDMGDYEEEYCDEDIENESQYINMMTSNQNSQLNALMSVLSQITSMTKTTSVQEFIRMKKQIYELQNENEELKRNQKQLIQNLDQKENEITILKSKIKATSTANQNLHFDEEKPNKVVTRKSDSEWNSNQKYLVDYSRDSIPKNESDKLFTKSGSKNSYLLNNDRTKPTTLYEQTIERMNHKQLFNKTIEAKKQKEQIVRKRPSPVKNNSLLLNDSQEKQTRDIGHANVRRKIRNYKNNSYSGDKQYGNLIKKPRNDTEGNGSTKSKLRSNILRKILADDGDISGDIEYPKRSHYLESRNDSGPQKRERDYSLEHYKRQINMNKSPEMEALRERINRSRSNSRSASRSMNRHLDISNERINVGQLLDYYKDRYE